MFLFLHDLTCVSLQSKNQGQPQYLVGPPQDPRGGLYAPNIAGGVSADTSIRTVVRRLMSPGWQFYDVNGTTVTLTITWAIGIIGPERFEYLPQGNRQYLSRGEGLDWEGENAGLSTVILDWLKDKNGSETLVLPLSHFV
jgi:hypothetical protein